MLVSLLYILALPEFTTRIQLHEIAIDVAVIERLFKALTAGQTGKMLK